jgi:hypothetical protein
MNDYYNSWEFDEWDCLYCKLAQLSENRECFAMISIGYRFFCHYISPFVWQIHVRVG